MHFAKLITSKYSLERSSFAYIIGFFPLNTTWQSIMIDDLVHSTRLWALLFLNITVLSQAGILFIDDEVNGKSTI